LGGEKGTNETRHRDAAVVKSKKKKSLNKKKSGTKRERHKRKGRLVFLWPSIGGKYI